MQIPDTKQRLAVFDFDGTLTYRDTLLPFLWHISNPTIFFYKIILSSHWLAGYVLGLISNEKAKNRLLINFLSGKSVTGIQEQSRDFVNNKLPYLLRKPALKTLKKHQRNGDLCILISASPDIYLDIWGKSFNFDHIITTRITKNDRYYTGSIQGRNCYGQEKVSRLKQIIDDLSEFYIISYGDSRGDRELFNISDEVNYKPFRD